MSDKQQVVMEEISATMHTVMSVRLLVPHVSHLIEAYTRQA